MCVNNMTKKVAKYLAFILFSIQILFLIYANFFLMKDTLDNDVAKLFVHIMKMWEHKTLFIPGWSNMTTLEIDCSSILALPIYAMCRNIYVSYALANIIFAVVFCALTWSLVKRLNGSDTAAAITCAIVLTPISFGQLLYYNMMFFAGGQYVIKALIPLLLIWLLTADDEFLAKKGHTVLWVAISVFVVFMGALNGMSSALFVLGIGIVPITASYMWFVWIRSKNIKQAVLDKKLWVCGCLAVATLMGAYIAKKYGICPTGSSFYLTDSAEIFDSLSYLLIAQVESFGALPLDRTNIFSFYGIMHFSKMIMLVGILVMLVSLSKKQFAVKSDEAPANEWMIRTYMLIMTLWNIFMLIVSCMGYAGRYLYCSIVPIFILLVTWWEDIINKLNREKIRYIVGVFASVFLVFVISLTSDVQVAKGNCIPQMTGLANKYTRIIEKLKESDENVIVCYLDSGMAETMRLLDYGSDRHYLSTNEVTQVEVFGYYSSEVDYYDENDSYILIINTDWYSIDDIPESLSRNTMLIDEMQMYQIYKHM